MKKSEIHDHLKTNQDARGIAHWKKHKEKSGGLKSFGVGLTRLCIPETVVASEGRKTG